MYFFFTCFVLIFLIFCEVIEASGTILWGSVPFILFYAGAVIFRYFVMRIQLGSLPDELNKAEIEYKKKYSAWRNSQKKILGVTHNEIGSFFKGFSNSAVNHPKTTEHPLLFLFFICFRWLFSGVKKLEEEPDVILAENKLNEISNTVFRIILNTWLYYLSILFFVALAWYLSFTGLLDKWI
jgi:hypothetical protein